MVVDPAHFFQFLVNWVVARQVGQRTAQRRKKSGNFDAGQPMGAIRMRVDIDQSAVDLAECALGADRLDGRANGPVVEDAAIKQDGRFRARKGTRLNSSN